MARAAQIREGVRRVHRHPAGLCLGIGIDADQLQGVSVTESVTDRHIEGGVSTAVGVFHSVDGPAGPGVLGKWRKAGQFLPKILFRQLSQQGGGPALPGFMEARAVLVRGLYIRQQKRFGVFKPDGPGNGIRPGADGPQAFDIQPVCAVVQ